MLSKIDFTTFAGQRLVDWTATPTSITVPSGAVTDSLLATLTEDSFVYINVSSPTTSVADIYIRAGVSTPASANRVIAGVSIGTGNNTRFSYSGYLPAGTKIYITKPAATFNAGGILPLVV